VVVCARPDKPPFSPRDCAGDPGITGIIPKRSSPDCNLIEAAPPPLIGSMQLNIIPPVLAPPQFGCVLPFMSSNIRSSLEADGDSQLVGFTFDSGPVDGSSDPCDLKLEAIIRLPPLVFDMDYDDWPDLIDNTITAADWVVILGKLSSADWDTFPITGDGGDGGAGGGGVIVKVITHTSGNTYVVEVYENGQDRAYTRTSDCIQLQLDSMEDTIPAGTWAIATEITRDAVPGPGEETVMYMQVPIWLPAGAAPATSPTLEAATGNLALTGLPDDGDTFILDDGLNPPVTFEFDSDSSVAETGTLRQVVIGGDVLATITNAIAAVLATPILSILSSEGAADSMDLVNQTAGTVGNIAIAGTDNAGVQIRTGMSGGVD